MPKTPAKGKRMEKMEGCACGSGKGATQCCSIPAKGKEMKGGSCACC